MTSLAARKVSLMILYVSDERSTFPGRPLFAAVKIFFIINDADNIKLDIEKICETQGYPIQCSVEKGKIRSGIWFPAGAGQKDKT